MNKTRNRPALPFPIAFALLLALALGCSSDDPVPKPAPSPKKTVAKAKKSPPKVETPKVEEKPDPAVVWNDLIKQAETFFDNEKFDEAQKKLDELNQVYKEPEKPTEEQLAHYDELKNRIDEKLKAFADQQREEKLAAARKLMDLGKFDEATQALDVVIARLPTPKQRKTANAFKREIERRRQARRRLMTYMKLMGSTKRSEVRAAQNQLSKEPETALPLLLDSVQSADNPVLVANSLETLRRFKRPKLTLPAMVGVLKRVEQQKNWPDAVNEIARSGSPGAGESLLELSTSAELPAQRDAALTALARVIDPPPQTLVALLPLIYADGPELASALQAANNAVHVHQQFDLVARRGLDGALTPEQAKQLGSLPGRLSQIAKTPSDPKQPNAAAYAAKVLAIATRQRSPEPLKDVKVASAVAEAKDSPSAAVLDGVWNSTELKTMWQHPLNRPGTIILDLGAERTVVGVRIWNFNQQGGTHRGWKEIDVFVSNSETSLTPSSTGIVPRAPGAADTPDYSTLIPVSFVRGRYVKLRAKNLWQNDNYSGLAEIQVLGF